MTQEQFQQRWCQGDTLCSLPEGLQEPPHHPLDSHTSGAACRNDAQP